MYKVLLIDDEILIRERISKKIPWNRLGYELTGTCANGQEAIPIINQQKIDVILTDICMPYVDGLDLAKFVYENQRKSKVVIITGYDEFEYAKKAVEYHVFSFVLKPVTSMELMEKLNEVKCVLDDERTSQQVLSYYKDSYPILKNQFLLQLAEGRLNSTTIYKKMSEFQMQFSGECYCAVILYTKEGLERQEILSFISEFKTAFGQEILPFEGNDRNIVFFGKKKNSSILKQEVRLICQTIKTKVRNRWGKTLFCLMGTCVTTLEEINISYQTAMELKEYLYLDCKSGMYEWENYQKAQMNINNSIYDKVHKKRILLAVQSNLMEEVRNEIYVVREKCQEKWVAKSKVVVLYQNFILAVMNHLERLNLVEESFFMKEQELLYGLYRCSYLTEMETKVLEFFRQSIEQINKNRKNYGEHQAMLALQYINEHYSDADLTLQKLCKTLSISVSYFSSVFKNHTGMTFVEALTKQRMEHALELLKNPTMKTYEAAERCGYSDSNYFSSIFKKTTGKTPRDYAKSITGKKGEYEYQDKI